MHCEGKVSFSRTLCKGLASTGTRTFRPEVKRIGQTHPPNLEKKAMPLRIYENFQITREKKCQS